MCHPAAALAVFRRDDGLLRWAADRWRCSALSQVSRHARARRCARARQPRPLSRRGELWSARASSAAASVTCGRQQLAAAVRPATRGAAQASRLLAGRGYGRAPPRDLDLDTAPAAARRCWRPAIGRLRSARCARVHTAWPRSLQAPRRRPTTCGSAARFFLERSFPTLLLRSMIGTRGGRFGARQKRARRAARASAGLSSSLSSSPSVQRLVAEAREGAPSACARSGRPRSSRRKSSSTARQRATGGARGDGRAMPLERPRGPRDGRARWRRLVRALFRSRGAVPAALRRMANRRRDATSMSALRSAMPRRRADGRAYGVDSLVRPALSVPGQAAAGNRIRSPRRRRHRRSALARRAFLLRADDGIAHACEPTTGASTERSESDGESETKRGGLARAPGGGEAKYARAPRRRRRVATAVGKTEPRRPRRSAARSPRSPVHPGSCQPPPGGLPRRRRVSPQAAPSPCARARRRASVGCDDGHGRGG